MSKAKYIAIEGIDGSGKGTQTTLLHERLLADGFKSSLISFPHYSGIFGKEIGHFLTGKNGITANDIDPKSMALWFAADRASLLPNLKTLEQKMDYIIFDRYVYSNIAYQAQRVQESERTEFINWIRKVEFEAFKIPTRDVTIVLDILPDISIANVTKKGIRAYTEEADVYEKNSNMISIARDVYKALSRDDENCKIINCMKNNTEMLTKTEISELIFQNCPL